MSLQPTQENELEKGEEGEGRGGRREKDKIGEQTNG